MHLPTCLIGDIGGTNARFALARPDLPGYARERVYASAGHASLESAIDTYLREVGLPGADGICLAVAGPISDGTATLTNSRWNIAERSLRAAFGAARVRLINDFEAVAHALPRLGNADLLPIGKSTAPDLSRGNFRVGVLGPGTGLGAAGLVRENDATAVLATEAGHVGFAPETPEQRELLARLHTRFERVSDERVASGAGLENIYQALNGRAAGAAEIFERAYKGRPAATQAIELFFEVLGQIAGNLALSMGAFQGIYIAGGMVQRNLESFPMNRFRSGFENKGRQRIIMEKVPTLAIRHPQPGLLGASLVAQRMLD